MLTVELVLYYWIKSDNYFPHLSHNTRGLLQWAEPPQVNIHPWHQKVYISILENTFTFFSSREDIFTPLQRQEIFTPLLKRKVLSILRGYTFTLFPFRTYSPRPHEENIHLLLYSPLSSGRKHALFSVHPFKVNWGKNSHLSWYCIGRNINPFCQRKHCTYIYFNFCLRGRYPSLPWVFLH